MIPCKYGNSTPDSTDNARKNQQLAQRARPDTKQYCMPTIDEVQPDAPSSVAADALNHTVERWGRTGTTRRR